MAIRLILAILFLPWAAWGATNTAANVTLAAVQAAVNASVDGDTVIIPSGNATWTDKLAVTNNIRLLGAGTNSTVITNTSGICIGLAPVATNATAGIRLSGIQFFFGTAEYSIKQETWMRNVRIDHCFFRGGYKVIWITYGGFGVVDHCTFLNCNQEISVFVSIDTDQEYGKVSYTWGIIPATTNTMTVEDCYFLRTTGYAWAGGGSQETLYGDYGGRCTFRYNRVEQDSTDDADRVDAHGCHGDGAPYIYRGTALYEIYGNTYLRDGEQSGRIMFLRGGTHFVFSNTFPADSTINLCNEYKNTPGSDIRCLTYDVITNSFFWSNTAGTVQVDATSSTNVVENTHYFTHAPASTNNFYPYTPLVYPHPIVTAQDGTTARPLALRVGGRATLRSATIR